MCNTPILRPTIALSACSKSKRAHPAPARDLYTGQLFCAARAYVEEQGWDWYILSAFYGLVHPDLVIPPYDLTLNTLSEQARRIWSWFVFRQVRHACETGNFPIPSSTSTSLTFLAGTHYRRYLVSDLRIAGYTIHEPLAGLGYGQQVQWLQRSISPISANLGDPRSKEAS